MNGQPAIPPHIYQVRVVVEQRERCRRSIAEDVSEANALPMPELTAFYEIPSSLGPTEFVAALRGAMDRLRATGLAGASAEATPHPVRRKEGGARCGLW